MKWFKLFFTPQGILALSENACRDPINELILGCDSFLAPNSWRPQHKDGWDFQSPGVWSLNPLFQTEAILLERELEKQKRRTL